MMATRSFLDWQFFIVVGQMCITFCAERIIEDILPICFHIFVFKFPSIDNPIRVDTLSGTNFDIINYVMIFILLQKIYYPLNH